MTALPGFNRPTLRALQITVAGVLLILMTVTASAQGNVLPESMTAEYEVLRGSTSLGTIMKTLKHDGNVYRVSSVAKPNALVSLVAGGQANEEAVFTVSPEGLRSVFYSESRTGKPSRQVDFDWTKRLMFFKGEGKVTRQQSVPDMDTVDASSLPFYLMIKPIKELAGKTIGVVTGKRLGKYTFMKPKHVVLQTNTGKVDTWRVEKHRLGTKPGTIVVWMDPARNNIPVKIMHTVGDKITTLNLLSLAGL